MAVSLYTSREAWLTDSKGGGIIKKFKGMRPLDEILRDAEANGFTVDPNGFANGSDWITLMDTNKRNLRVDFNAANGRFICSQPPIFGVAWATERSVEREGDERYDELLALFYIPMDEGGAA